MNTADALENLRSCVDCCVTEGYAWGGEIDEQGREILVIRMKDDLFCMGYEDEEGYFFTTDKFRVTLEKV